MPGGSLCADDFERKNQSMKFQLFPESEPNGKYDTGYAEWDV